MEPLAALGTPYSSLRRSVLDPITGQPVVTSAPTGEVVQRSSLLPLGRTDEGRMTLAMPEMALSALGAMAYPGQVARGEASIYGADGRVSDEAVGKAFDLAGTAMTGSLPFSKPAGAIGMFGGRNAATADLTALKQAQTLHDKFGASREHIWDATGWFKGADNQWKFEIPDDLSTIASARNAPPGYSQLHHDDLAEAYPSLWSNTQQSIRQAPVTSGRYEAADGVIHAQGPTDTAQRSVALHELQHALAGREGFAAGDNPGNYGATAWEQAGRPMLSQHPNAAAAHSAWARDQYHRSAGEVEARNVQARMNFTPEQRFNIPPWATQDVADADQIIRLGRLGQP
jgi:hypothetical protein